MGVLGLAGALFWLSASGAGENHSAPPIHARFMADLTEQIVTAIVTDFPFASRPCLPQEIARLIGDILQKPYLSGFAFLWMAQYGFQRGIPMSLVPADIGADITGWKRPRSPFGQYPVRAGGRVRIKGDCRNVRWTTAQAHCLRPAHHVVCPGADRARGRAIAVVAVSQ